MFYGQAEALETNSSGVAPNTVITSAVQRCRQDVGGPNGADRMSAVQRCLQDVGGPNGADRMSAVQTVPTGCRRSKRSRQDVGVPNGADRMSAVHGADRMSAVQRSRQDVGGPRFTPLFCRVPRSERCRHQIWWHV